jgi:hypothetical protein
MREILGVSKQPILPFADKFNTLLYTPKWWWRSTPGIHKIDWSIYPQVNIGGTTRPIGGEIRLLEDLVMDEATLFAQWSISWIKWDLKIVREIIPYRVCDFSQCHSKFTPSSGNVATNKSAYWQWRHQLICLLTMGPPTNLFIPLMVFIPVACHQQSWLNILHPNSSDSSKNTVTLAPKIIGQDGFIDEIFSLDLLPSKIEWGIPVYLVHHIKNS